MNGVQAQHNRTRIGKGASPSAVTDPVWFIEAATDSVRIDEECKYSILGP